MSEIRPDDVGGETPSVEVRIFRRGRLLARELCESEEDAAAVVARWEDEADGIECEVSDLAATARDEAALEVEPLDVSEAYPTAFDE